MQDRDGNGLLDRRINVREEADWHRWIIDESSIDRIGRVVFQRTFNWLELQPAPERVELVVSGQVPDRVDLNGSRLMVEADATDFRVDVLKQLQSANRLVIFFELENFSATVDGSLEYSRLFLNSVNLQVIESTGSGDKI